MLARMGLPEETRRVHRETRMNGVVYGQETRGATGIKEGYSVNGVFIENIGKDEDYYFDEEEEDYDKDGNAPDIFTIESWMIRDGKHQLFLKCKVTAKGRLLSGGKANIFPWGWMPLDQAYVSEMFDELRETEKWDLLES